MDKFLVAHCERVKAAGDLAKVSAHNSRKAVYDENLEPLRTIPEYIDPESGKYNEGDRPPPAAVLKLRKDRIREAELIRAPRKDASFAIEVVITASPDWFKRQIVSDNEKAIKAFFVDARKALNERFGAANLLQWNTHYDETTPHMHLLYVPIVQTEKGNKYSADAFMGNRKQLAEFQDYMIKKLGAKYGLERGVEGSDARHTNQKEWKKKLVEKEKELNEREKQLDLREAELKENERYVGSLMNALNERDRERIIRKVQDNYRER
jgi:hypothetical protein